MTIHSEFDVVSKNIDGVEYTIRLLNTSEAYLSGQKLLQLALPVMGAFADGVSDLDDPLKESSAFTAMAFHMAKQLGDVNTLGIIILLLDGATANGVPINFEKYFRGKLGLLVHVIEFAIKENYGSLFTDMDLRKHLTSFMGRLAPQILEPPSLDE